MLKEPAEPESAQRRNRAKREQRKRGKKGVTMVMQKGIERVSLKNKGTLQTQQQQQQRGRITISPKRNLRRNIHRREPADR